MSCEWRGRQSVCMDAVSIKIHQTTITYLSHNDTIWVDGKEVVVTLEGRTRIDVNGGCKIKIARPYERVTRYVMNALGFIVRIRRHIYYDMFIANVRVAIGDDFCCSSPPIRGICGTCKDCTSYSFLMPCSMDATTTTNLPSTSTTVPSTTSTDSNNFSNLTTVSTTITPVTTTKATDTVTDVFIQSTLPLGTSIIEESGVDDTAVAGLGPGNAVCNDDASMITELVQIFNNVYVSIEFFVKTCHEDKCTGTILSYTSTKTFAVKNINGKIGITYGDLSFQLALMLENEKWNQVALVYDGGTYLDVYVFDSTGTYRRDLVELDGTHPFSGKGRLALGKWQPPPDGSGDQPLNEGFEGCIDELRVWDRFVLLFIAFC